MTYPTVRYNKMQVSAKISALLAETLSETLSTLKKFRHNKSVVEMCHRLSSTKVDAPSVICWTQSSVNKVDSTSRDPTVDR